MAHASTRAHSPLRLWQDAGEPTVPTEVRVTRSDPIYNAHGYLTKVPYTAIVPFIEALTEPGDFVLDIFAGSGMTGVAAAVTGRRAELRDISALGRHIGSNYLSLVPESTLRAAGARVVEHALQRLGGVYEVACAACHGSCDLSKAIWTFEYACPACGDAVNYYEAFKAAGWVKAAMACPHCQARFRARGAERVGEVAVADWVRCPCSRSLREQAHEPPANLDLGEFSYPDVRIASNRQMFQASALAKHGLESTASFFTMRNLAALSALREAIHAGSDDAIRSKLLFCFTAILARASKRYQWHPKRPLNASNHNYYIAPVFYEWNVFELFVRKVEAAVRADRRMRDESESRGLSELPRVNYRLGSADSLDLPDDSVDLVFTDPPFGSNIFYSDMNLFQEVWLGVQTDHTREAVVDRTPGPGGRTAERYEALLVAALQECRRVLKPSGHLALVFSNSSGAMWSLIQRTIAASGLCLRHVTLLDKGQRSVKGLASGFEDVVTSDLILTLRNEEAVTAPLTAAPDGALEAAVSRAISASGSGVSPTSVYLAVVREFLIRGWSLESLDIAEVRGQVTRAGLAVDPATGLLAPIEGARLAS